MVASWRPDIVTQVAFNADPNDPVAVPTWTNLSHLPMRVSSCKRGRQYELDQNQANAPTLEFYDPDELLNPANTAGPYYGQLLPYRQVLIQAVWPNTTTGNILNTSTEDMASGQPYDGSFEAYSAAASVPWITAVGSTVPVISTTTPQQGVNDLSWTVVNGATVQGVSFVLPCIPGRQYTASAYVRQTSASTQRISVDGSAGTSTATTGSYVRLSKTFTATQPTHVCQVATTGAAVAGTVRLDAVQHEQAAAASTFTTSGPTIYGLFRGFIERWPRSWQHRNRMGLCVAKAVDAFGPLNRFKVEVELRAAIANTSPTYWWTLGESADATAWQDQSGKNEFALGPLAGVGATTSGFASGVASGIPGDPDGLGVEFPTLPAAWSPFNYLANSTPFPLGFNGLGDVSIAIWWTDPETGNPLGFEGAVTSPVMILNPTRHTQIGIRCWYAAFGNPDRIEFFGVTEGPVGIVVGANAEVETPLSTGLPRMLVGTLSVGNPNSTWQLYQNGSLVNEYTHSTVLQFGTATPDFSASLITVGGFYTSWFGSDTYEMSPCPGLTAHVAVWNRVVTADEVQRMYAAGTGGAGETSGERIERYLTYQGWVHGTKIDTGLSRMGVNALAKSTALLGAIQEVGISENGNFFADKYGNAVFADRNRRYMTLTPKYVLGEDAAAGENPYLEGIVYDRDPMRIYNDVKVTNGKSQPIRATDATSVKRFFPNTYEVTINVADSAEAAVRADWILTTNKDPEQRVAAITFDPGSNPALWPFVLGVEIGDRVTVKTSAKSANSGAGITMSRDHFVESVSHDTIDMQGAWRTTLTLSPVPALKPFILGDPVYGVLGDATLTMVY